MPDVRVGIVSWNTGALLERCLRALPAALEGVDAEVVVVDNASDDDSVERAKAFDGVRVVRNGDNVGYARAMNQALEGTNAPYLIALNPDTEPPPRSLATLVRALGAKADVALVAPRLVNSDGSDQHSVYRFPSVAVAAAVCWLPRRMHRGAVGRRLWLEGGADHRKSGDVDWAIGAVHCIRRAALDGELPYSERWFMYVEDLDLCARLHARGWRVVFDADVVVPHVGNAAGEVAWGDRRTAMWFDATYDWYALERGPLRAWLWAAVNAGGLTVKIAWAEVAGALPLPRRAWRRTWAGELKGWLRLHWRKLAQGPRAAASS